MKRLILSACLMLASPLSAAAAPTDAQLDTYLTIVHAREQLETATLRVLEEHRLWVDEATASAKLGPRQQAALERLIDQQQKRIRDALAWTRLAPIYRDLYRSSFSSEDLEAITRFYASPAGQKARTELPKVAQNTDITEQNLMRSLSERNEDELAALLGDKANATR